MVKVTHRVQSGVYCRGRLRIDPVSFRGFLPRLRQVSSGTGVALKMASGRERGWAHRFGLPPEHTPRQHACQKAAGSVFGPPCPACTFGTF